MRLGAKGSDGIAGCALSHQGQRDRALGSPIRPAALRQQRGGTRRDGPLIPFGGMAQPEEIARAAVFLASENAGFVTGQTLHVNGGSYLA